MLELRGISKLFPGVRALDKVSVAFQEGEIHALLGENGAGKSTLMNILVGLYQPDKGDIYLKGDKVRIDSPSKAVKLGIGMVHQHFMLVEALTVFENIILGITKDKSLFIKKDTIKKEILKLADRYGLDIEIDRPLTEISVGAQQRVEILKALYRGAELLILDEPTAALDSRRAQIAMDLLRKLAVDQQAAVVAVTHDEKIFDRFDRMYMLRDGKLEDVVWTSEAA